MNVKYSFGNVRTMTLHLTTCRVNIWGYLNPIPINRVKIAAVGLIGLVLTNPKRYDAC